MSDAFSSAELEHHRAFLQRLARGLVRGEGAAEDLVQEAFVRALERPPSSARALRTWLASVVRHLAVNRARSDGRRDERERRSARPEGVAPPDEALASLELEEQLVAALKALDEPYRTTLWLRFHEGLAPGAIATRLALPVKTMEARFTRGLAALRADLDRRSGGDRRRWLGGVVLLARGGRGSLALSVGTLLMKKALWSLALALVCALAWRFGRSAPGPTSPASESRGVIPAVAADSAQPDPERIASARSTATRADSVGPPESPTALGIRVLWDEGGTPAPDVGLILRPEADPRGARAVQLVYSDEAGLVRVAPILPGTVRIEVDRGGEVTTEVRARAENEVRIVLVGGIDVEGVVSDASGAPLAGAEVLVVAPEHDWLAARTVARTGANGAYRVRAVQPALALSARADGFAPALLRPLHGRGQRARLDFTLDRPGARLRGIVRDPEGRPVASARVAVGDPSGYAEDDPEGVSSFLEARGLRVETTDAAGRFHAAGAYPGFGLAVAVQAEGFPIALANVRVALGATAFAEIVLAPPATLSGVVRTPAGQPAGGVRLTTVLCDGTDEVPFALPAATSDAAGRFRLELLPARSTLRLDPGRALGAATLVTLRLPPGETQRDLVLAADDALRGRVEAPAGTTLDGWFVQAYEQLGGGRIRRAPLAADGRFEVASCDRPPYRLELYAATDRPVLRRDEVAPGPELVLAAPLLGVLRGMWVDQAGLLPAGAVPEIRIAHRESVTLPPTWLEDGRFVFERLRPGRYRFTVGHAERVLCARTLELAPGEDLDLGRIPGAAPGSLAVTLDPHAPSGVRGSVHDDGGGEVAALELVEGPTGPRLGAAALPPGEWLLELEAEGQARFTTRFRIESAQRTELAVALAPGVERSLAFRVDPAMWETLAVELRDARGELVLVQRILRRYWPTAGPGPILVARLAVGTYALAAETDTGLRVRASFDVPALVPQEEPLAFEPR